ESVDSPHEPDAAAAPRLRMRLLDDFVRVEEQSGVALVGTRDETVVAAGSDLLVYGDGGVGKTTLELDALIHLAAGTTWLGLEVPRPLRIVIVENEGPRGPFRRKVERRAEAWTGPPFRKNLHFLEEPWAAFTFADPQLRVELAEYVT